MTPFEEIGGRGTAYERGRLVGEMVSFLEELVGDPNVTRGQRVEARRLIDAAEIIWGKP